ncbi:MAG: hypothetical protein D6820_01065 [Lentisphaerae bacterium]|nr:MAG: hypothetical protein D6820_01065 [Lentisphaerota bacterium]
MTDENIHTRRTRESSPAGGGGGYRFNYQRPSRHNPDDEPETPENHYEKRPETPPAEVSISDFAKLQHLMNKKKKESNQ